MSNNGTKEDSHIQYDVISLQDLDEVNELLVNEFFRDEPLGRHLGANPDTDVRPWISQVTEPLIAQGVSIGLDLKEYYIYIYILKIKR